MDGIKVKNLKIPVKSVVKGHNNFSEETCCQHLILEDVVSRFPRNSILLYQTALCHIPLFCIEMSFDAVLL
jgi:hypothetical protein